MRFSVTTTPGHQGKSLEVDIDREQIIVYGVNGQILGAVNWGTIVDRVIVSDEDTRFAHNRAHARAPLAVRVRYTTPEGKQFDSLTGGIGGGGLFIESSAPLTPGTELAVEFSLPDRPWEKHKAKAKVAWARSKPERYLLFPGMGVQFTEIQPESRTQLVELVNALNRNRAST